MYKSYESVPDVYNCVPDVYKSVPDVYNGVPDVYKSVPDVYNGVPDVYPASVIALNTKTQLADVEVQFNEKNNDY